ncbi:MAG: polymer-forming cytoskeletal protein, partial [Pseudomonadota bacterium]
ALLEATPRKGSGVMKSAGVPSIISSDVVMRGNINSAGEIQFDGSLEGDVKAGSLIIGEKASVKGEVVCETVTVRGRVEGGIRAKSVSLAATAHILGDILHSSLSVETGAHFEGNCRHSDDPLSDTSAKDFRRTRPTAPAPAPRPVANNSDTADQQGAGAGNETPSFLSVGRSPLR